MSRKARFAALAVVVAITLAVLLWVAVISPLMPWHVYRASDIQALPEAQLLSPVCGDDVPRSPYMMGDPCTNRYFVKIFAF